MMKNSPNVIYIWTLWIFLW